MLRKFKLTNKNKLQDVNSFITENSLSSFWFACHAALPLYFRLDFLYHLLSNFKYDIYLACRNEVHYSDIAELITANFISKVSYETYEFDGETRLFFLNELLSEFGDKHLLKLANFLHNYAEKKPFIERETHQLTALSFISPSRTALEFGKAYNQAIERNDKNEQVRLFFILDSLTECLSNENIASLESLRTITHLAKSQIYNDLEIGTSDVPILSFKKFEENSIPINVPNGVDLNNLNIKYIDNQPLKKDGRFNLRDELDLINGLETRFQLKVVKVSFKSLQNEVGPNRVVYAVHYGKVTGLRMEGLNLESVPQQIRKLKNLKVLSFSFNKIRLIKNLPDTISVLYIDHNQISNLENIPKGLTKLCISSNKINRLENLPYRLKTLFIDHNQIKRLENIPPGLFELSINNNRINFIENLPHGLNILAICFNEINNIENIPPMIVRLDIRSNKISDLSPIKGLLQNSDFTISLNGSTMFKVGDNPLMTPPPEIVEKGRNAVLKYFFELEKGFDSLFEAKLLVVGEPGAGKTTLSRKLISQNASLPSSEEKTRGIDIHQLVFPNRFRGKPDFRVNLWDFGGQSIYHTTHQFFLTKRSLYLLIVDGRKGETDFNYWLQLIELVSGASPVIIVQNEKHGRKEDVDLRGLQGRFKNVKEFHSLDLSMDLVKLQKLKDAISYYAQRLDHVGQELPKQWVSVRRELEVRSKIVPYITREEYFNTCQKQGIEDKDTSSLLSGYLHDLGVILHFQEDSLLKHYLFLRNEWATDAVYTVLDDLNIKSLNNGHFDKKDIIRILYTEDYQDMHDEVIQLMIKFELAYQIPDQKTNRFIVPQLLKVEKPEYNWNKENNIQLSFQYSFIPNGLISRLIVKLHKYITDFDHLWRSGAIFYREGVMAEVVQTHSDRTINVRVAGNQKKEFLTIISNELDDLSKGYERLQYEKMVPCDCSKCKSSITPNFYQYSDLGDRLERNQTQILCNHSFELVNITNLIVGVEADKGAITKTEPIHKLVEPLKLFISYSKHDMADLLKFKKAISPLLYKGKLISWDDSNLIPAEEWNSRIEIKLSEADVIVFLTSIDSLATDYILSKEMEIAEERHKKNEALILPIILDDCLWDRTILGNFNALPTKGVPIHSKKWNTIDEAWTNVVQGLVRLIHDFQRLDS